MPDTPAGHASSWPRRTAEDTPPGRPPLAPAPGRQGGSRRYTRARLLTGCRKPDLPGCPTAARHDARSSAFRRAPRCCARSAARRSGSTIPTRRARPTRSPRRSSARPAPSPQDQLSFPTPEPQPGGVRREYWIQARTRRWDVAPTGRDDWHNRAVGGKRSFRALVYQLMQPGFAAPAGPAADARADAPRRGRRRARRALPQRRDEARARRSRCTRTASATRPTTTASTSASTRASAASSRPGEEFTYTWEATPDSVGVWPYHDHGPNHTLNTFRGAFGAIVIRERGAKAPDVEHVLFLHQLLPPTTGLGRARSRRSTAARSRATRRRSRRASARTSRCT